MQTSEWKLLKTRDLRMAMGSQNETTAGMLELPFHMWQKR